MASSDREFEPQTSEFYSLQQPTGTSDPQRCIRKETGRLVAGTLALPENPGLEQLGGFSRH